MGTTNKNVISTDGITVLSLCDGMSCGQIALEQAGIKVKKYYASEIKPIGIKVTQANYPDTIQVGDVNKITYLGGVLHTEVGDFEEDFDLVIFGSPCQSYSICMKTDLRVGRNNKEKSGLFDECYRILKEVNPKYFLMENVESMKNSDRDYISSLMGVAPIMIDAAKVSPVARKRYYWTNIPNVTQPDEVQIALQDILEGGYTDRKKGHCLLVSDSRPLTSPSKMFHRYYHKGFNNLIFKSKEHYQECCNHYNENYSGKSAKEIPKDDPIFNGVRYLTQKERERCHGVPEGYTSCLNWNEAADVLGDGWAIDVVAHIFTYIK